MKHSKEDFWEQTEQVNRFAEREPDKRMSALLQACGDSAQLRILDLGCAGGRNTVLLAGKGYDFYAVDASHAMVRKTRERVSGIVGPEQAERRVLVAAMDDLSMFASKSFQIILAFGVYHNARCEAEWQKALSETTRLLSPDGQLLMANFDPTSNPKGRVIKPVAGETHVYDGFSSGRLYLLNAAEMDTEMKKHGLEPVVATETVHVKTDTGERVTVNGHYQKR